MEAQKSYLGALKTDYHHCQCPASLAGSLQDLGGRDGATSASPLKGTQELRDPLPTEEGEGK